MRIHELSGAWGTARVAELGGCVLSWRPAGGDDVLFLSQDAELTPGTMWHGGIPVCAPWFGKGQGDWEVPHTHGLVSRVAWATEVVEQNDDGAKVVMSLTSAAVAEIPGAGRYPDDLAYRLEIEVGRTSLTVALTITSPTREAGVDLAFHPYLRVDATRATISGLENTRYLDAAADWQPGHQDGEFAFDGHVDRVYAEAPPVFLSDGSRTRRLSSQGATRTVVWNPGPVNDQVAEGEWREFVCVEYGNVRDGAVTLPAGGEHRLAFTLEV
ncbi:hypothetical protein [Tessaracoccus massiliensis]|uniref:aldose epimerase family protein n=1 Tax=Tessaracoccus massiliensis TaxID=1522311 RepID=UPI00058FBED5|nr:hypothetical protein [Tessaracoccus massiliensis]